MTLMISLAIDNIPVGTTDYDTLGGMLSFHKNDETGFYYWAGSWVLHSPNYPKDRMTKIGDIEPYRERKAPPKKKVSAPMQSQPIYPVNRGKWVGD